ncbi:uncharacterized protein TNCV_4429561 [Trichonephila clavipes]|nr:uncharacterized protein TNCV_4429561 [Trichonephila clavipes]
MGLTKDSKTITLHRLWAPSSSGSPRDAGVYVVTDLFAYLPLFLLGNLWAINSRSFTTNLFEEETVICKLSLLYVVKFTCRNCGGGDRGRVAIYRPFGEVSLSLNRTVTCMVLKANDRRTSCPCHDEFRGPRSDYVRQVALATTTTTTKLFY